MSNIRKLERIAASLAFFLGGVLILGDKEALGLFFTLSGIFAYIPNETQISEELYDFIQRKIEEKNHER